jgi:hypothetical protein
VRPLEGKYSGAAKGVVSPWVCQRPNQSRSDPRPSLPSSIHYEVRQRKLLRGQCQVTRDTLWKPRRQPPDVDDLTAEWVEKMTVKRFAGILGQSRPVDMEVTGGGGSHSFAPESAGKAGYFIFGESWSQPALEFSLSENDLSDLADNEMVNEAMRSYQYAPASEPKSNIRPPWSYMPS